MNNSFMTKIILKLQFQFLYCIWILQMDFGGFDPAYGGFAYYMLAKHFLGFSIFSVFNKIENQPTNLSIKCVTKVWKQKELRFSPRRLCLWVENWLTIRIDFKFLKFWNQGKCFLCISQKSSSLQADFL